MSIQKNTLLVLRTKTLVGKVGNFSLTFYKMAFRLLLSHTILKEDFTKIGLISLIPLF
nr:MAG TPA: hypothetical protein [Caudoviricetes sp.]